MRRFAVAGVALSVAALAFAPSGLASSARVAALQIGLRAHGFDPGPVDGVRGPRTRTRADGLPAQERCRLPRAARSQDATRPRSTRPPAARAAAARRGRRRLGRRRARVPAAAVRPRGACGGRPLHPQHRGRAEPLPAAAGSRRRRDRRPEHVPRARGERADRLARRLGRGELLLDRRALPHEPVAARPAQLDPADQRDRARAAARAPGGCTTHGSDERGAAREPGRGPRRDRLLGEGLRRRSGAGEGARVDGVRASRRTSCPTSAPSA